MVHIKSHVLQDPGQKQGFERSLGQTCLLILVSLLETGGNCSSPWDTDTGAAFVWSLLTTWPLVLTSARVESPL